MEAPGGDPCHRSLVYYKVGHRTHPGNCRKDVARSLGFDPPGDIDDYHRFIINNYQKSKVLFPVSREMMSRWHMSVSSGVSAGACDSNLRTSSDGEANKS